MSARTTDARDHKTGLTKFIIALWNWTSGTQFTDLRVMVTAFSVPTRKDDMYKPNFEAYFETLNIEDNNPNQASTHRET